MRRRSLALLIGSLSVLAGCSNSSNDVAADVVAKKNVIFFLGDGYGMVPMTAARIYAVGEDGELAIDQFPECDF